MERLAAIRVVRRFRRTADGTAPRLDLPAADELRTSAAPIFIVGCQRSGTSLVRRIVDSHPRIACPPESKFVRPLVQVLRDEQAMHGLASLGYERDVFVASLARYIDGIFTGYSRAKGKARWADKTPNYVDCLDELWELFGPGARFILVIRHGLDVAYSLGGGRREFPAIAAHVEAADGDRAVGAARFWRDQNATIERFRTQHPDVCFRLRYEEVAAEPETTLRALFAFLDEPWIPDVMHHERSPHDAGLEDPDVRRSRGIEPRIGTSRAWPAPLRQRLTQEMEPVLTELGYANEPVALGAAT